LKVPIVESVLKVRLQTWLGLFVGGVLLLLTLIGGLWLYTSATAPILHPKPRESPSVIRSPPAPQWSGAVRQGQEIVRAALSEQNLPGISVAVGAGRDVVWAEGFGWADLESQIKIAPDTRFRIGTLSTPLTSAAVGLLLEKGRLKLDDEIQTYVPAFPKKPWPVTLGQLMGHVAGVRNDGGDEGPLLSQRCERLADALPAFADRPLRFEPGTRYAYSSYGWILVSAAVEAAADEPFSRFMRTSIFEPLGLDDTRADSSPDPTQGRATSYFPRFAADPRYGYHLMRPVDYSCYAGSSAFLSTPTDLVRFAMAINHGRLLQPATVQLLQTPQRLASGEGTGYGLGWDFEDVALSGRQTRVVGHDGDSLGGMVASLMTVPAQGIVVSVTSNISYADTFTVAMKLAEAFAAQAETPAGK